MWNPVRGRSLPGTTRLTSTEVKLHKISFKVILTEKSITHFGNKTKSSVFLSDLLRDQMPRHILSFTYLN